MAEVGRMRFYLIVPLMVGTLVLLAACGTPTPTPTQPPTLTPTASATPTPTLTLVSSPTPSATPTSIPTATSTATSIPTPSPTPEPTATPTAPAQASTPTPTATASSTPTPIPAGDDHPDAYPNATTVTVFSTVSGTFEDLQDVDMFVLLTTKKLYRYSAVFVGSAGVDVELSVLNQFGNPVAFGGVTDTSTWTAENGQPYYIKLDSFNTVGNYTIEFRELRPPVGQIFAVDDHPNIVPQSTAVEAPTAGSPVYLEGVFEVNGDVDVFSFVTGNDGFYDVWTQTPSALTVSVVDAAGNPPADIFVGSNFKSWTTTPGKTWYVVVSGSGTARYRVQLWVPD